MNKEFLDPNTKYSDQKVDLAKMPELVAGIYEQLNELKDAVGSMYPTDTASGAVASFSDGADGVPVESLIVNIDPVQEGSGDPSPENIRPITGHDEVIVTRTDGNGENPLIDTITLGDTVYGGALNVTTGELTVNRAMVDLGTLEWTTYSSPDKHIFRASYPEPQPFIGVSSLPPHAICSSYYPTAYGPISANDNGAFSIGNSRVIVIDHRFSDAVSFGSAINGVQLCYEFADPITIQLTPQQITTLYGTNNFSANTGNVSVTYKADIELYIQKKISTAVASQSNREAIAKLTDDKVTPVNDKTVEENVTIEPPEEAKEDDVTIAPVEETKEAE